MTFEKSNNFLQKAHNIAFNKQFAQCFDFFFTIHYLKPQSIVKGIEEKMFRIGKSNLSQRD